MRILCLCTKILPEGMLRDLYGRCSVFGEITFSKAPINAISSKLANSFETIGGLLKTRRPYVILGVQNNITISAPNRFYFYQIVFEIHSNNSAARYKYAFLVILFFIFFYFLRNTWIFREGRKGREEEEAYFIPFARRLYVLIIICISCNASI